MPPETLRIQIDASQKIISFRFVGLMPSKACADNLIEAMEKMDKPWLYKQIWDYRRFDGILDPEDVERIAIHWRAFVTSPHGPIPTAVLAADPLTPARAKAYASLFPNLNIRSFTHLNLALEWLGAQPDQASAA